MSGIAGFVRLDDSGPGVIDVVAMAGAIAHRGPDQQRTWSDAHAALIHSMLWTTPSSLQEQQPLVSHTMTIVADVRLDNRAELLEALDLDHAAGDAALILAAYRRWGSDSPRHLEGDFAFAIWNSVEQVLFCARDPFGVKALVYSHRPGSVFAFASEVRGVVALREIPRDLDDERVRNLLLIRFEGHERTFHRAVKRLPPGHTLRLERTTLDISRYWDPRNVAAQPRRSDADFAEGFRDHFVRAVKDRMQVPDPSQVGAMLSGGLDSTAIVCVARDALAAVRATPLPVFSWIFSDTLEADEREYQEAVVREGGLRPFWIDAADGLYSPFTQFEQMLPDGPPYSPNMYLTFGAAAVARGIGVRVILEGLGGDSIVSRGGARFVELFLRGRGMRLLRELRAHRDTSATDVPRLKHFVAHVVAPLVHPSLFALIHKLRGRPSHESAATILRSGHPIDLRERWSPTLSTRAEHLGSFMAPMSSEGLELFDRAMAASGVEGRYPFFDRRLAEYCLSLPGDQKMSDGYNRMVVRRALDGVIPPAIQWRAGKGKPGLHIIPSLRMHGARMESLLFSEPQVLERWVEIPALRERWQTFREGRTLLPFREAVQLWSAAALAGWLRQQ